MRVMEQLVYVLKCFLENWRRKYSLKSKNLMEQVNFRLFYYIYDWCLLLTALAGLDYEGISENISFSTGSSPGNLFCFNLTILDDEDPEESEYFNLTIRSLSPGVIMNTSIIEFLLADDDSPPFNGRLLLHENIIGFAACTTFLTVFHLTGNIAVVYSTTTVFVVVVILVYSVPFILFVLCLLKRRKKKTSKRWLIFPLFMKIILKSCRCR